MTLGMLRSPLPSLAGRLGLGLLSAAVPGELQGAPSGRLG